MPVTENQRQGSDGTGDRYKRNGQDVVRCTDDVRRPAYRVRMANVAQMIKLQAMTMTDKEKRVLTSTYYAWDKNDA